MKGCATIITIYSSPICSSSTKAKQWFMSQRLSFTEKDLHSSPLELIDVKSIIRMTDEESFDLIKNNYKSLYYEYLRKLNLYELTEFLKNNVTLINTPIILSELHISFG